MNDDSKDIYHGTAVPAGRLTRLGRFGRLAGGIAGSVIGHGTKQVLSGERPELRSLLLTQKNVGRVADQLSQLRGAAMKLGQLVSMDSGNLLSPELAELLARLRSGADPMPMLQLDKRLTEEWGADWQNQFSQFTFKPIAAASIGQVHKATLKDGRAVAIKVQYPGVDKSIDSDIDNALTLLKISGLLPKELKLDTLVDEAKLQLHAEADYRVEREHLQHYRQLIDGLAGYQVPNTVDAMSTRTILTMDLMHGHDIEQLASYPQWVQPVGQRMFELLFREIFDWQRVQTDPNFANYQFDPNDGSLILLDFGATRSISSSVSNAYQRLLSAGARKDTVAMTEAARSIGYFEDSINPSQMETVLTLFQLACEPLTTEGEYDFAHSDLPQRIRDVGLRLSMQEGYWHSPPVDALFLHRKMAGLFLLAQRVGLTLDLRKTIEPWLYWHR